MTDSAQRVLLTGAAGFIGMHAAERLLAAGYAVVGVDNLNDYYAVSLKEARLARLLGHPRFHFERADIAERDAMARVFDEVQPHIVLHLAAQAGVRYSLKNPWAYVRSNLDGFMAILEGCRATQVQHLLYASSSSVYGNSTATPFVESQSTDAPVSLYAATKKSNEVMAHAYSHLYQIPMTGLRFFTVYGPWGRPDMSPHLFLSAILEERPIEVFNQGQSLRDFTYVGDLVEALARLVPLAPQGAAPNRVLNVGNGAPVRLGDYIATIEALAGKAAQRKLMPAQAGDVDQTFADRTALEALVGPLPRTRLADGLRAYVEWYRGFHAKGRA